MNAELMVFAEEVRREATRILCLVEAKPEEAIARAESLVRRAGVVYSQAEMQEEVEGEWNLAELPPLAALPPEQDPESTEYKE